MKKKQTGGETLCVCFTKRILSSKAVEHVLVLFFCVIRFCLKRLYIIPSIRSIIVFVGQGQDDQLQKREPDDGHMIENDDDHDRRQPDHHRGRTPRDRDPSSSSS